MTILEARNFYNKDEHKYILSRNNDFLLFLMNLLIKDYRPFMEIKDLQKLIDKLVTWYEIKYPEHELMRKEGVFDTRFSHLESISKYLGYEELLSRLLPKDLLLLETKYRSRCGGGNNRIILSFKDTSKEYIKSNNIIYLDSVTGTNTSEILGYLDRKNIKIDDIYNKLKENKNLDLSEIKECIINHEYDILLRNKILELTALKLLYSKNTTPKRGYERAKYFIDEFNKYLNINLRKDEIDNLINRDYSHVDHNVFTQENEYELTLDKKIDLENKIKCGIHLENLTKKEIKYVNLALKMPIDDVTKAITWYKVKNKYNYKSYLYEDLKRKWNCSLNEVKERVNDVLMILKYNEQQLNKLLKEHKSLVKKINY